MRYDTKEEIEATGEWLLKINSATIAEELMYVPSELSKLGVAPIDVVDSLEYLREMKSHLDDENEPEEEIVADSSENRSPLKEAEPPDMGYDSDAAWKWAEDDYEDFLTSLFDFEPDLPEFNNLISGLRSRQSRIKGKRARTRKSG